MTPARQPAPPIPLELLKNSRRLRLGLVHPKNRPPVLSEMMPHVVRLMRSLARQRADDSCYALHADDLVSECNLKLAALITKSRLDSIPNRHEAFAFVKTVFNNHLRSIVARHRMTLKRGGRIDPDDTSGERRMFVKNVDVALDDEEARVQVADKSAEWNGADSMIEDYKVYLTPAELMVLREWNHHGDTSLFYAQVDAMRGKKPGEPTTQVKIGDKHLAEGLGLDLNQYRRIAAGLRQKIREIRMSEQDPQLIAKNRARARLEEVFSITIPLAIQPAVVKRILTLAAVDHFDRVQGNQQVIDDLTLLGAAVPTLRAGMLACFGVLYQKNARACCACALNASCQTASANHGLSGITLDPKIIASKMTRTPTLVPSAARSADSVERVERVVVLNNWQEELVNWLDSYLVPATTDDVTVYTHPDVAGVKVTLRRAPFEIQLHKPDEDLKRSLVQQNGAWCIPTNIPAEKAIDILDGYANGFIAQTVA